MSADFSSEDAEHENRLYCDLIIRIGRARDKEAFHKLYEHFEHAIFNLASYLTNDKDSASDMVQEAMLAIWNAAPSFEPGPAKGWIYRIASRKCLSYNKKRKKSAAIVTRLRKVSTPTETADAPATAEHRDVLNKLRNEIGRLDLEERKLITLYFWVGLSQQEIAKQMTVSQRTISTRIENAVQKLRSTLKGSMKHSMTPALFGSLIGEVLEKGIAVPIGLRALVLKNVNETIQLEPAQERGSLPKLLSLKFSLTPVLIMMIAGGAFWGLSTWNIDSGMPETQVLTTYSEPSSVTPDKARKNILYDWDFRKSSLKGFKILSGDWRWVSSHEKIVSGMFSGEKTVVALFPINRPKIDFAIELDVVNDSGSANIGTTACTQTQRIKCTQHIIRLDAPFTKVTHIYKGRDVYGFIDIGQKRKLILFLRNESDAGDKIKIGMKNNILRRVRIRELTPEESTVATFWQAHAINILKTSPGYKKATFYTDPSGSKSR